MKLDELFVEKYRPSKLEDLIISDENRTAIESFGKNVPHLMFCGSQGVGKTSLAKIIVEDILGCDFLYINASDENGVDVIRDKVTGFAQTKSLDGELKVIILDEADFLTTSAQAILRNLMETYAGTTRFILTANYKHKIIPALHSRCQSIDLKPDLKNAITRCHTILKNEKIVIEKSQLSALANLVKKHFPDLRKCIHEMQKYCSNGVLNIPNKEATDGICETILDNIKSSKSLETRTYLIKNDNLFNGDWESLMTDLLNHYYKEDMDDILKKQSILTIADHLFKMVHVTDREICFFACILTLEQL